MKFGRLLAAGRSMHPGHPMGRYQMNSGMALPQFISPKNPFKAETSAPAVTSAPKPSLPTATTVVTQMTPQVAPQMATRALVKPAVRFPRWAAEVAGRLMNFLRGWGPKILATGGVRLKQAGMFCLDHNPFSAIGRPRLPGIPRFGRATVQGELSLDRVRVVRNDLAQADLEVVRVGAAK